MSIVGNTYLERGEPVVVLVQWRGFYAARHVDREHADFLLRFADDLAPRTGPRNVLIRRSDGELVVRPFRGLRKVKP